ncbi:methyltransferase [bacterium]|nr:methyltransferase [bacterium]
MARREKGEPLAHILGQVEFCGLQLAIGPAVFVPRPRAEVLLDVELGRPTRILDLGCGCGALAAAVKQRLPDARVVASDRDLRALEYARINAQRYSFQVRRSDWMAQLSGRFDLILAYLPHVPLGSRASLDQDYLRAEGEATVLGGADGLDPLRAILPDLKRHGRMLTLLEAGQLPAARLLTQAAGCRIKELAGDETDRVVEIVYLPSECAQIAPP